MPSHASLGVERRIEHRLFLLSFWSKGVAGLLETLAGIPFFFLPAKAVESFTVLLTAPELAEDHNDWLAVTLRDAVEHFTAGNVLFAGAYLVIHGLIKILLVTGLLLGRLWGVLRVAGLPRRVHNVPDVSLCFYSLALAKLR